MNFELQNIEDYTKNLTWMFKTATQLEHEFCVEKWIFTKPLNSQTAFQELVLQLNPKLNNLLEQKGAIYCTQLLYTIDVSESQIAKAIALESDADFAEVLTKLIIRRCLQKVLIRNYYNSPENFALGNSLEE